MANLFLNRGTIALRFFNTKMKRLDCNRLSSLEVSVLKSEGKDKDTIRILNFAEESFAGSFFGNQGHIRAPRAMPDMIRVCRSSEAALKCRRWIANSSITSDRVSFASPSIDTTFGKKSGLARSPTLELMRQTRLIHVV